MHHFQPIRLIVATCYIVASQAAHAQEERTAPDEKGIFNMVWENDKFAGTDRDYTNGVRFSWISSEENMPEWSRNVADILPLAPDGHKRISIAVGQSMFAPQNLQSTAFVPNEQPYAGWLYGSVGMVSDTGNTLDNVMLTLGVVGPLSGAEQTQKFIHRLTDSQDPKGWDNQLENEPGIILTYERKWRGILESSPLGIGVDVTPHVGVNLGNINTDASVGATFRLGYDLPADYGPPRIRPSLPGSDFFVPAEKAGGYLFATVGARAVGRNIFLDGNSFRDGPSVDKKYLVSSLQVGVAATYEQTRISYTQVFMDKEYKTQAEGSQFGVLTVSYRF
jgi:lipid A 3-O-deacylase